MTVTVSVFKDLEKWSLDLRKQAAKLGGDWEKAKELVSKIDFTQRVRVSDAFYLDMKGKPKGDKTLSNDVYQLGANIANGQKFKAVSE